MAYKDPQDPRRVERNRRNSRTQRAKRSPEQIEADRAYQRAWREANRERNRATQRAYNERHKERIKERNNSRQAAPGKPDLWSCRTCEENKPFTEEYFQKKNTNKFLLDTQCRSCMNEYSRINIIRHKYGLTKEEADDLRSRACVICGATERIHIDHCHRTGKVRGPLCSACNNGLGCFRDNPTWLRRAAEYVETHL